MTILRRCGLGILLLGLACTSAPERSRGTGGSGGDDDTGGSGGAPPKDAAAPKDTAPAAPPGLPASDSQDDLAAFVDAEAYRKAPWISETPGPRPRAMDTSPHGTVRVWMNDKLVASLHAGHDGFKDQTTGMTHPPLDKDSMAVKEFYDDNGTKVGAAALFKSGEGALANTTVYYCKAPIGRCLSNQTSDVVYGNGIKVGCGFCHGGMVYTKAP
jgi:hypothetical protein